MLWMFIFNNKSNVSIQSKENCHCILLGGNTMNEKRYIWWNFVASDIALIETAKKNWLNKKFIMPVDDAIITSFCNSINIIIISIIYVCKSCMCQSISVKKI